MNLTPREITALFFATLATCLINAGIQGVAPGLMIFAWTPVWAAYALWQHLLGRERTRMPRADKFDQEFRTLLEKEGQQ